MFAKSEELTLTVRDYFNVPMLDIDIKLSASHKEGMLGLHLYQNVFRQHPKLMGLTDKLNNLSESTWETLFGELITSELFVLSSNNHNRLKTTDKLDIENQMQFYLTLDEEKVNEVAISILEQNIQSESLQRRA